MKYCPEVLPRDEFILILILVLISQTVRIIKCSKETFRQEMAVFLRRVGGRAEGEAVVLFLYTHKATVLPRGGSSLHSGIEFGRSRTGKGSSGGRKKGVVGGVGQAWNVFFFYKTTEMPCVQPVCFGKRIPKRHLPARPRAAGRGSYRAGESDNSQRDSACGRSCGR